MRMHKINAEEREWKKLNRDVNVVDDMLKLARCLTLTTPLHSIRVRKL